MTKYSALLNWPNRITMLRICLIGPFVLLLLNVQNPDWPWARLAALGLGAAMGMSDVLDGMLARRYNQESSLGKFLDPLADKLVIISAMILLGYAGTCVLGQKLPSWVVVAALGKDLFVVLGFSVIFLATGKIFIKPGRIGKGCTVGQMLMICVVLASPDMIAASRPAWLAGHLYNLGYYGPRVLWFVCTALALATAWDYFRSGLQFSATQTANADKQSADLTTSKDS